MENIYAFFISYLETGSFLAYIVSFCAGVLVSFTPCVYPLIPINIGVITAEAPNSRLKAFYLSLSFVIGTALVYSVLGIVASLMGKVLALMFGGTNRDPLGKIGIRLSRRGPDNAIPLAL